MEYKKFLFVGFSLKVGGIERAFVEQVNFLAEVGHNIDLFLFSHNGSYLSEISPKVNFLPENKLLHYAALTQIDAKLEGRFAYLCRTVLAVLSKLFGSIRIYNLLFKLCPTYSGYDYSISYFQNGSLNSLYCGCNEFVLNKVCSKKKIAWIHSDYVIGRIKTEYNDSLYRMFDAVVNVSYAMKEKFDALQIVNKNKSFVVYNRIDIDSIIRKSVINNNSYDNLFKIVTVGRLEKEKGTDKLFEIAKNLKEKGMVFKWQFIGTGVMKQWCKQYISDYNLGEYIELVGQISNPYPLIKNANLLVSGSLSETFGLSIIESLILNTPVVAFNYNALKELIRNNENGISCEDYNQIECEIFRLSADKDTYNNLKLKTEVLTDYNTKNDKQLDSLLKTISMW